MLFWNNLLVVISQHHIDNTPESHFSGKPSLINCCFAGPKTLRRSAGSLQPRCLLMIFAWVHRSSQRVPSGSGGGFWVFSLGIFHGVWLIVKGGFLTSVSHIFHGPRGLVRNRMTAYAHAVSTEERGRGQTSKYVLTAVRRFGVSVSGTKHCRRSMGHCLHATWPTWSVTAGIYFTESITRITHLFYCVQHWRSNRRALVTIYTILQRILWRIQNTIKPRPFIPHAEERSDQFDLAPETSVTCKHIAANVSWPTSAPALRKRWCWIHLSVPRGADRALDRAQ